MSKQAEQTDTSRRRFIAGAAVAGAVTLAPGVTLMAAGRPADQPASSAQRWGLLIDANRCTSGCNACVTACKAEHGIADFGRPETDPQWIRKVDVRDPSSGHSVSLPVMCQHCDKPPCVDVCPTGASMKRADGIVLVDKHICIGCRYCMMACPYKARSFVHEPLTGQQPHSPRGKGTVESCNLCVHRVDRGGVPACVEACIGANRGAMTFGDLNDPNSRISQRLRDYPSTQIRADLRLNTGVRYQGI